MAVSDRAGMLALTYEIMGVKQILRVMGVSYDRVRDLRPVWDDIGRDFYRREQRIFDNQGLVTGWAVWKPINEQYRLWKIGKGWSSKIMVKGGRLMHSLTERSAADTVFRKLPRSLEIGTRVPYAKYHQRPGPDSNLSKREVIRVTDAQRRFWFKLIKKFLVESGQFERSNLAQASTGRWTVRSA